MLYRIVLCFIEASWIEGNQPRYVLWKISQKKNESDVLKKYTQKMANKKITRDKEESGDLTEGRIGHAETGANVFGEKFNGAAIGYRVGLRQVFHGFYQHFLAVDIAGIGSALALFAR
jgi:hypothetical protein